MIIHVNYERLTRTEKDFVDDTTRKIMRSFQDETLLPYGLLADDQAEIFVEAFATFLTESSKARGFKRAAVTENYEIVGFQLTVT